MSKPLLGLVMICKNEAAGLRAVLESFKPFIDYWTIYDTGSTDGTLEIIRDVLAREGTAIPGNLAIGDFVDFSTARNRALDLHEEKTKFSIMPNGDLLEGGAKLRAALESEIDGSAYAYNVRIKPGHYYLPLVLRTGGGWRYHGRTHEVPMGPGVTRTIPGVSLIRDRSTRTREQWCERWMRDRALLEEDVATNPNDERSWFYLAQTYECLGDHGKALTAFQMRTTLGGYFDERFEAKFRIGKMLAELKRPWPEIQAAYLDAYAFDPRRAEPLYKIAEHWYDNNHAMAYLFAARAAELPKPATDLFIDEEVYAWKAADTAAISGFYLKDDAAKTKGREFAERCVRVRPSDERLRANLAFYGLSAGELFKGYKAKPIGFTPEAPWSITNPSIYYDGGTDQWRCIARTVNYKIVYGKYYWPSDDTAIRTRNFMLDLDGHLGVVRAIEMIDKTGIERSSYPVHGFEDCRLFKHNGKLSFTATVCDFDLSRAAEGPREIVLGELDDSYSIVAATPLRGEWSNRVQKNWMPRSGTGLNRSAGFVYALGDDRQSTVFELDGSAIKTISRPMFGHGRLRGGSQLVYAPDGFLCLVHDVAFAGDARMYLHRFVALSTDYRVIAMTDPFYFEKLGIEFCAGLAYDGKRLVASFGVDDRSAHFAIFDFDAVYSKLRTDFQV